MQIHIINSIYKNLDIVVTLINTIKRSLKEFNYHDCMVDEWIPAYIKTVGEDAIATFLTILKDLDDIQYDDFLNCWMKIKEFVTNAAPTATDENHRTN